MPERLIEEQVKILIEQYGYRLIDSYKNNRTPITIKNSEGFMGFIRIDNLLIGQGIRLFYKSNPYTIDNIKLWLKLNNKPFELLSNEYISAKDNLRWKCSKENCGEIFESSWDYILHNHNCPYCEGYRVGFSNCLATKNPKLASEWHPTKNGDLTPWDVTCGSGMKVWWLCSKCGYEWETIINQRNLYGCIKCRDIQTGIRNSMPNKNDSILFVNPSLCKEWDYLKNKNGPENYYSHSNKKVWWKCKDCGHEWQSTINHRHSRNCGCRICGIKNMIITRFTTASDYNLLVINPNLCKEWDYDRNDKSPEEYYPNSDHKAWWKCQKCGYKWKAIIGSRNGGVGCPKCKESKGESKIYQYLLNHDINFIRQYRINDCRNIYPLPFDFAIFDNDNNLQCLIEYDGQLHYFAKDYFGGLDTFQKRQFNDSIKTSYCLFHNIPLLRIPYWEFENIEVLLEIFLIQFNKQIYLQQIV